MRVLGQDHLRYAEKRTVPFFLPRAAGSTVKRRSSLGTTASSVEPTSPARRARGARAATVVDSEGESQTSTLWTTLLFGDLGNSREQTAAPIARLADYGAR